MELYSITNESSCQTPMTFDYRYSVLGLTLHTRQRHLEANG